MSGITEVKRGLEAFVSKIDTSSSFFKSFMQGTLIALLILIIIFAWGYFNQDKALEKIQSLMPSKTVSLELPELTPSTTTTIAPKENNQAPLPTEVEDGMSAFDANKKSFTKIDGHALISIVVVDYGLSEKVSQSMIDILPDTISLVLTPYSFDTPKWADVAKNKGYEFWLSLPMQTKNIDLNDVGPKTLLKNAVEQDNLATLNDILAKVTGYVGVVTSIDHDFVGSDGALSSVIKNIQTRGLGLVEINDDITPLGLMEFSKHQSPFGQNDFWLDKNLKPDALKSAFITIEQKAKRDGHVIVFTRPYPSVLAMISEWSKDLESKNLQLAPLSYLVQQK